MHDGRVVHFEDDPQWLHAVASRLEGSPHQVVGQATTLAEALDMLKAIRRGELDANIVINGGMLSVPSKPFSSTGRRDPAIIAEKIEELGLEVRTIGISGLFMSDYGVTVDAEIPKVAFAKSNLVEVINALPEPEARS